jgi:hypothetical protein
VHKTLAGARQEQHRSPAAGQNRPRHHRDFAHIPVSPTQLGLPLPSSLPLFGLSGLPPFITKLVIARLSRPDAADLVTVENSGVDVAGLREEAAAIRRNLEELAADRAMGLITRPQMLAATSRANVRLMRSAANWSTPRGRTCSPRWSPPRTSPPCGRTWTSAASVPSSRR